MKKSTGMSRREVIRLGVSGLAVCSLAGLATTHAAEQVDENSDLAKQLKYKHDGSQIEGRPDGQLCNGCAFFHDKGDGWGTCIVFSNNSVNANGWCTSFRAKQ